MKELQKAVAAVSPIAVRFAVGDVVRHRLLSFRGVVFDVDPEFANSEEWWESIPEAVRPAKEQPRSEEHTSELQSLMRISYAVFCLKKKNTNNAEQKKYTIPN